MSESKSRLLILIPEQDDGNEVSPSTTDRPNEPSGNIEGNETFGTRKSRSIRESLSRPLVCSTILIIYYMC